MATDNLALERSRILAGVTARAAFGAVLVTLSLAYGLLVGILLGGLSYFAVLPRTLKREEQDP